MKTTPSQDILAEVWAIKDTLSARHGHDLKATCRAIYAEQAKHPGDFVNLGGALAHTGGARKKTVAKPKPAPSGKR